MRALVICCKCRENLCLWVEGFLGTMEIFLGIFWSSFIWQAGSCSGRFDATSYASRSLPPPDCRGPPWASRLCAWSLPPSRSPSRCRALARVISVREPALKRCLLGATRHLLMGWPGRVLGYWGAGGAQQHWTDTTIGVVTFPIFFYIYNM